MVNQATVTALDTVCAGYVDAELELLRQLCSVDCQSKNLEGNAKVVEILKSMAQTASVTVEEVHDETVGTHLILRIKPENPDGKILISAHTDTFHIEGTTVKEMPFRIDGDWVHGRGVVDCKGGVVSSFYSIKVLQEAGLLPNKEIVMMYTCDEEIGSPSSRKVFEKECVNADFCFVFEPTRNDNSILLERPGLKVLDFEFKGKTAHPGTAYRDGRSAAKELAQQAMRLFDATDYDNITIDVCNFRSSESISASGSCRAVASLYSAKGEEILNGILHEMEHGKPFVDGCSTVVKPAIHHPRMGTTDASIAMYEKIHQVGLLMGYDYPVEPLKGASDGNLIYGLYGVPCIDGMGPYMKDIHTANERMYLPSLKERTLLFALTLASL